MTPNANTLTVSVDAMGGDIGPAAIVPGLDISRQRHPELAYILVGDEAAITPVLKAHPRVEEAARIIHTDVSVAMDAKPSQALRQGRRTSSMWKAIEAVKTGDAGICVSAGNTGALMAMSKFCLKTLLGVDRPGIAAIWPTTRGESIVLDVGATVGADTQMLIDFALLGSAMARTLFGIERPTVGLLNVGVEEVKGLEPIREAGQHLREAGYDGLDYVGFVEGNDIGSGRVDVVVTEGFSGNIALKTAEGTARQVGGYLRDAMRASLQTKLGALLAKPGFDALRRKMDPSRVNGGVFLGLNGTVVKSHGGADALGIAAAVDLARLMVHNRLSEAIADQLRQAHQLSDDGASAEQPAATQAASS
ncbi:MAG: phosphate acyltransferase PlsX [Devosiaceae bacterium]|nr:phosphate acyltransferase PlsX [Devosiaceae bacterium MH13]